MRILINNIHSDDMQSARLEYLLQQQITAALTPQEQQELDLFLTDEGNRDHFTSVVANMLAQQSPVTDLPSHWRNIPDRILAMDKPAPVKRLNQRKWLAAAAAILILLMAGAAFWFSRNTVTSTEQLALQPMPHIAPGSNKAILTLADGSTIPLDSNGRQLIRQGNTAVRQTGGILHYEDNEDNRGSEGYEDNGSNKNNDNNKNNQGNGSNNNKNNDNNRNNQGYKDSKNNAYNQASKHNPNLAISYNTLTTPRGGQFQVRLPDGSVAWLNAASSLRYPTLFNGAQRLVQVTGEVYFEVAANAAQPFVVQSRGLEITVLGTHFNVNTYKDDGALHVTLLEGAVKVKGDGAPVILHPGQAAAIGGNSGISVTQADVEQTMAWKNGFFVFRGASLEIVLNQLSRWYNLDVAYTADLKAKRFIGKMPRSYSLEEISAVLKESGVYITIAGNKMHIQ